MRKVFLIAFVFNFCMNNAFLEIKSSYGDGAADDAIGGIGFALSLSLSGMLSTLAPGSSAGPFLPDLSALELVDSFYI